MLISQLAEERTPQTGVSVSSKHFKKKHRKQGYQCPPNILKKNNKQTNKNTANIALRIERFGKLADVNINKSMSLECWNMDTFIKDE